MPQIAFEGRLQDVIVAPGAICRAILAQANGADRRGQRLLLQACKA
jgi:hypothetical protein